MFSYWHDRIVYGLMDWFTLPCMDYVKGGGRMLFANILLTFLFFVIIFGTIVIFLIFLPWILESIEDSKRIISNWRKEKKE